MALSPGSNPATITTPRHGLTHGATRTLAPGLQHIANLGDPYLLSKTHKSSHSLSYTCCRGGNQKRIVVPNNLGHRQLVVHGAHEATPRNIFGARVYSAHHRGPHLGQTVHEWSLAPLRQAKRQPTALLIRLGSGIRHHRAGYCYVAFTERR